jgi:hypothetical protein
MFKHLKESDVQAIIAAAERNNATHPPSKLDVTLEEARERRGRPDPTRIALEQALGSLPHEARIELMALVWFGRGDSIETDFAEHVAEATRNSNEPDVDYIAETSASLPVYLRAGLDRLKSERPRSKWNIDDVA